MSRLTDNLTALIGVKNNIKDAIEEKGVDMTGVPFTEYHEKILEIEGEGGEEPNVPEPAKNFLIGHTLPIAIKNKTAINTFFLESDLHNITVSGLDSIATVTGNGTKRVEWTVTENGNDDLIVLYTISINGETHYGRQFYYGVETDNWVTLAYKRMPTFDEAGLFDYNWVIIESPGLPGGYNADAKYSGVSLNQILSTNTTATSAANGLLRYCTLFNQPLPSGLTSVGGYFLYGATSFNQPLPSGLTSVGGYFLYGATSFNQPLPSEITTVGDNFLSSAKSFNQPLPSGLTSVGNYFLSGATSFNQPLPSGLTSVGNYFLSSATSFNQPLPSEITTVGSRFLYGATSFNQPLPSGLTTVGDNFLSGATLFNQPLPSGLTSVGSSFLSNATLFNQPLPSGLTSVGNYFLYGATLFNQPLPSGLTSVGDNFLSGATSFNQPLPSGLTSVGSSFLRDCTSFNRVPVFTNLTSVGSYFMYNCNSLAEIVWNVGVYPTDNNTLASTSIHRHGTDGAPILISGTHASGLKSALADSTTSPYRKLEVK